MTNGEDERRENGGEANPADEARPPEDPGRPQPSPDEHAATTPGSVWGSPPPSSWGAPAPNAWGAPPSPQPQYPPPQSPWSSQGVPPSDSNSPGPQAPQPPAGQPPSFWPPAWGTNQPGYPGGPAPQPMYPWPPFEADRGRTRLPQLLGVVAAVLIAFSFGMVSDRLVFGGGTSPAATTADLKNFDVYREALEIVKSNFVGRANVSDEQLLYGSIKGMVDSLGDTGHSVFLTPDEYQRATQQLSGQFAGIGVVGTETNGTPAVERVLPGSPADKAGVKAGDEIVAVDGVSTVGMSFSDAAPKIRGSAGTKVRLTVVHLGTTQPVEITITREFISLPLVSWAMVPGTKVADIVLTEFSQGASTQLQKAISSATTAGAKGLILDMRGNPGGRVDEALGVASQFIDSGTVFVEQDANGNKTQQNVNSKAERTALPLVVLVDHDSASAAEIVAGALQDHKRAKVVGVKTFGTGTVLHAYELSDHSAIYLGTAEWLTPNGRRIFGTGITPDENVVLPSSVPPTDPTDLPSMTAAQVQASKDTQLLAAIKLLEP